MREDFQKRLSPEPLNSYYLVVKRATVILMLILQCILGLKSQSIDFINAFSQAYIPSGEPVFVEITRYFKSDVGQCDVVLRLEKIVDGQDKAAYLWYEKLRNCLLDFVFVASKVGTCLFMYKTFMCVVYVDDCLFWARSQYDIDNVMKSFKDDVPTCNWDHHP